ncbi:MAG: biosynthetic-type acetolactate synthase large subunit [Bacteroidales bacterium]|nr:biosynthetic-type acetolactate synthase large subunit [Bacteroidales bacterium]
MSERINGAEALMRSFKEENVTTIFGYPGGFIIPVFDALYSYQKEFDCILTRHEQGAVHAAQGYARVTGQPGVVIVTSGPAATNVITGLADAMLDSTPLVVITGQSIVAQLGTDSFQETDVIGITQPVTKWSYQIRRAEDLPWAVARAFYIAREGRPGPVVLDLTKDAQTQLFDFEYEKCRFIRSYQPNPTPDQADLALAADLINLAKRPMAVVGQGVMLGHAEKELYEFLEKADIPAASTLLGLSIMANDYPLNMGMVGMHGNVAPNRKTGECDVLIAIGCRFSDRVTGDINTYAANANIIHFDIDPSELNKNVRVFLPVLGNVKQTLPAVTRLLKPARHTEWIASFKTYKEQEDKQVIARDLHPEGPAITMAETVKCISDKSGKQAVLVADVGQNEMVSARYFSAGPGRQFVASGGLGTMGFCLPAAVGAALGAPTSEIYAVCGDGGIQMTIQELGTIMQYQLPVKVVVLNNNFLGMVRQWQELFWDKRYSSTRMQNPDFVQLAASYHIAGRRVEKREELSEAVQQMIDHKGPYLLEVHVEEEGMVYPMIPAGQPISNIIMGPSEK